MPGDEFQVVELDEHSYELITSMYYDDWMRESTDQFLDPLNIQNMIAYLVLDQLD